MRLLELDLAAFGPFTGRRLDLSGGAAGLHVLYGDNEAGKSSALRALSDLFFGIPHHSRDAHLHPGPALRLGATLQSKDGLELRFVRKKSTKASLFGPGELPLPDAALEPFLRGISRELFGSMFAVDHARLAEGAAGLLKGEDPVGAGLISASLGTRALERLLDRLAQEGDLIYTQRGKTRPRLKQLQKELEAAERRAREAVLTADEWRLLERELESLEQSRINLALDRQNAAAEERRLLRLEQLLPSLARLEALDRELELLSVVPELGPEAEEQRRGAEASRAEALRARAQRELALAALAEEQAKLEVDPAILAAASEIQALVERLTSVRDAEASWVELEEQSRRARARAEILAADRGRWPELPASAFPRARAQAQLLLLEDRDLLTRARELKTRGEELARAEAEHSEEDAATPLRPALLARLRQTARQLSRESALDERLAELARDLAQGEAQWALLRRRLTAFVPGEVSLEELSLPSLDAMAPCVRAEEELELSARRLAADLRAAEAKRVELEQSLAAFVQASSLPSEHDLESLREARDRWMAVALSSWREAAPYAAPVAAELEGATLRSDQVADRLRRESQQLAERAAKESALAAAREAQLLLGKEAERLEQARASLERRHRALWPKEITGVLSAARMQGVLTELLGCQALGARVAELGGELRRETERRAALVARATELLGELGVVAAPDLSLAIWSDELERGAAALEAEAREAQSRAAEQARLWKAQRQLLQQAAALEADRGGWRERWASFLLELSWAPGLSPSEVVEGLEAAAELSQTTERAELIERQLEAARARVERFLEDVRSLAGRLLPKEPPALTGPEGARVLEALRLRLRQVERDAAAQQRLLAHERALREELEQAELAERTADQLLLELVARAGAASLAELKRVEERDRQRRSARELRRSLEQDILALGQGSSLPMIVEEARGYAPGRVDEERAALEAELSRLDEKLRQLDQDIGRRKAKQSGAAQRSGAIEPAEEVQSLLAEARAQLSDYLLVRLSSLFLRRYVSSYREAHQAPLLVRASELTARLTLGSLARLGTELDLEERPIFVAYRADGTRRLLEELSDGTRDQLFLALRLASLEQYLADEEREPMPFIVDDILVHFDDRRSLATLAELGALSRKTQVLFFTHHRRLVELAERAVEPGQLFVHQLSDQPALV